MDIGVGLDASLDLSFDEQAELSREAARLGYTSVWTPGGARPRRLPGVRTALGCEPQGRA